MKAIKVMGTIDENGQLTFDKPIISNPVTSELKKKPQRAQRKVFVLGVSPMKNFLRQRAQRKELERESLNHSDTNGNDITTDKNSRVEVIVLIQEEVKIDEDDTPLEVIKEDFRQAWGEAMTGKTIPVAQIWDEIEDV